MAKATVAQLEEVIRTMGETIGAMDARLDKASDFCKMLNAKVVTLEASAEKTRKQLWYLQKVAKGEFTPGNNTPKATEVAVEGEVEVAELEPQCF